MKNQIKYFSIFMLCGYLSNPFYAHAQEVGLDRNDSICIEMDRYEITPEPFELAAKLAAFKMPHGLSVQQYQRLVQTAHSFVKGSNALALQHFALAIKNSISSIGIDNFDQRNIDELAFVVLNETVKLSLNEFRIIMTDIKRNNAENEAVRDYFNELKVIQTDEQERCPQLCDTTLLLSLKDKLDMAQEELNALSERGRMNAVELQNVMSRYQQVVQMVANLAKALNDTAQGVIENMRP